jgi:nucleotide-binding universal stress UspA family protein
MIKVMISNDQNPARPDRVVICLYLLAGKNSRQKMSNAILCTIDFSESSRDVLKYAVDLCRQCDCHLTVLYTYRLLHSQTGDVMESRKKIEEQAKQNFSVLEKDILKGSGIPYEFKVEVGFVSNRVTEYAKKNTVSFLVISKKMNGRSNESFDELAENIKVPLVIVP